MVLSDLVWFRAGGHLLRRTGAVVLDGSIVEGWTGEVGSFGLRNAVGLAPRNRRIVATAQNDGLMLAPLGLRRGLQAPVSSLGIAGGHLADGFADHFMTAGGAHGCTRLIAAASTIIEMGGGLLVAEYLRNEA